MGVWQRFGRYLLLSVSFFAVTCNFAPAQTGVKQVANSSAGTGAEQDGQHDFDWQVGTWKVHMSRLQHPLTGSTTWTELDGTVVVRKVWDGRANLAEIKRRWPIRPPRISVSASLQSPSPPVEPQFCQQQRRYAERAHDRRVQEWARRVLRSRII